MEKGEVLARLETTEYQADRDRARAALEAARQRLLELERGNRPEEIEAAKAELAETETQCEQLRLDWQRNLKAGISVSPHEVEQSYSAYKAMEHRARRLRQAHKLMAAGARVERIAAARAEVRQAAAELAKAEWRLDNCTVRAPIAGTILSKIAEEGSLVNQLALNLKGSLCDMADLSDLEVDLNVQERDVARVSKGQRCQVRPEAFPDRAYEGAVSRLMPVADRAKGCVPVRVKVVVPREEEGIYLKPEMGVIVLFLDK